MPARRVRRLYKPSLLLAALIVISASAYLTTRALASSEAPNPARTPATRAALECGTQASCRTALRRAYEAIQWQKRARNAAKATTVREMTLDAINWAAQKYHVSEAQMRSVGNCESHLWPWATNGQYMSWAQLSARHRSDPIIARLTWRDPYAVADHVARYIKRYGWGEWQCQPGGGLRW